MVCEQEWLLAVALLWGAVVLTLMGGCFQGLYFADRARHEQARRAASGPSNELPMPCCQFWINSDGEVHGPGCTRPVLPRRDTYRLHPAERAAFEEITARYDDRSSA
ncbi:hypothetical protein [Streptomyces prunicolor]|uniref:hypothetical protein n=1 Tax=Streptomyces prunicolor TaxID=67348 RepID=UPI0033F2B470